MLIYGKGIQSVLVPRAQTEQAITTLRRQGLQPHLTPMVHLTCDAQPRSYLSHTLHDLTPNNNLKRN
jgi:uroporphyrinogen-III synthase